MFIAGASHWLSQGWVIGRGIDYISCNHVKLPHAQSGAGVYFDVTPSHTNPSNLKR